MNRVINSNNMELMSNLEDKSIDQGHDDPPYFSGPEKRGFYGKKHSSIGVSRLYEKTETWKLPDSCYFSELKRVTNNQIIWGANYFDFIETPHKTPRQCDLNAWLKDHPTGWIVWDKCNGSSSFNDFELAWTSYDWPTKVYKFMWNGMLQGSSVFEGHIMQGDKSKNQKRIHPTEKPIPLYKWCNYITQPKSILSNFVGSGADRIAAYEMNIDFIGSELSLTHFTGQEKRFNNHISQHKLFS